jgi:hypothetical protein
MIEEYKDLRNRYLQIRKSSRIINSVREIRTSQDMKERVNFLDLRDGV